MTKGVNMAKITVVTLILVAMLLVSGVVLDLTNHVDQGSGLIYTAVGIIVGTGATTITVIQDVAQKLKEADPPAEPKP